LFFLRPRDAVAFLRQSDATAETDEKALALGVLPNL